MIFEDIKKFLFEQIEIIKIILKMKILFEHKFEKFEHIYIKIMNII